MAINTPPATITKRKLNRSARRPVSGRTKADTIMNTVTIADNDDRVQPISSVIGFSINPNANLDPPLKNITTNPAPNITQFWLIRTNHHPRRIDAPD